MDNEITEYRARTLKFDDNYDKKRVVKEKTQEVRKKSSAQGKNSVKGNDEQPDISGAYKIVARQTSYRTERKRSSDNQVDENSVKKDQVNQNCAGDQNKPRSSVCQFPTKRKKLISVGVGIVEVWNLPINGGRLFL